MTDPNDRCICGDDRAAHEDDGECILCHFSPTEPEPCKKFRKEKDGREMDA